MWHLRVRHARARAQLRYNRRKRRTRHIWDSRTQEYRGRPRLGTKWWIWDDWYGRRVRWNYERALALEDEAYMLLNRLHVMNADPASRDKRWLTWPQQQAVNPLT